MNILFDVTHPAHVHLFKNAIWALQVKGHQVAISSREKDITTSLLNRYGFEHKVRSKAGKGRIGLAKEMVKRDWHLYRFARQFRPDVLVGGVGNVFVPVVGRVIRRPSIVFDDTEPSKFEHFIVDKLASVICTPSCYKKDLGKKQVRYDGYHELAYLHPNYFEPDPSVLEQLGISRGERFIIIRLITWGASHDVGQHGFDDSKKLVRSLEPYGRVLITSEGELGADLEKHRITVPPEKFHHLLYFATLCVSEGLTIATEAAMLGTPSIHVSTLAQHCGNFEELSERYGLICTYSNQRQAVEKALELIQMQDPKAEWSLKREKMLSEKIDVTKFMVDFVENYPSRRTS